MDSSELTEAIQSLARIDHAGLLTEFQIDVTEACRGPADDLERHLEYKWAIHKFSRLACKMFGVSPREAEQAAMAALLPSTRRGITLRILADYIDRLDEEELKAQAQRSVRSFNRRRVGA